MTAILAPLPPMITAAQIAPDELRALIVLGAFSVAVLALVGLMLAVALADIRRDLRAVRRTGSLTAFLGSPQHPRDTRCTPRCTHTSQQETQT